MRPTNNEMHTQFNVRTQSSFVARSAIFSPDVIDPYNYMEMVFLQDQISRQFRNLLDEIHRFILSLMRMALNFRCY